MLDKAITLTPAQYRAAVLIHGITGDLLAQAAPTDETPLQISIAEVLEVAGRRLATAALGN